MQYNSTLPTSGKARHISYYSRNRGTATTGNGEEDKTDRLLVDCSAPEQPKKHEQGKIINGKGKKLNRRQRRGAARERRRARARLEAEGVNEGTIKSLAKKPDKPSEITHVPLRDNQSPTSPVKINRCSAEASRKHSSRTKFYKDDDDHSPAATAISNPALEPDAPAILAELLQWLKIQALDNPPRSTIICNTVRRAPQPQTYRRAQQAQQPTLGSLARSLRAGARARDSATRRARYDGFERELQAREPAVDEALSEVTSDRSKGSSHKDANANCKGKDKVKNPPSSGNTSAPSTGSRPKPPSRVDSFEGGVSLNTASTDPVRRKTVAVAGPAKPITSTSCGAASIPMAT